MTREGQLIFFFQFLHVGARWQEFLRTCPLHYTGNRGSGARNVMGTALLSILCGHWRYAHINAVRGDCGYGSETTMLEHEERGLPYLFKLRHTAKVKELVLRMMMQGAAWQALETSLRLSGWSKERRVILVSETPSVAPIKQLGQPRRGKDRQSTCRTPQVKAGKPVPPHGVARSPYWSARWTNRPFQPPECPNNTGSGRMPKTALTNSKTHGAGRVHLTPSGQQSADGRPHRPGLHLVL